MEVSMNRIEMSRPLVSRVVWFASGVLVLTTVHHVYGAYIYHTPWRLHAALASAFAEAAIVGAVIAIRRRPNDVIGQIAFWVFVGVTLLIPVLAIGFFEGWYNHVLKNALYFADAPAALLNSLFPPPTYEMPDSLFFEVTGVMQAAPGTLTAWFLYRLLRVRLMRSVTSRSTLESDTHALRA
jgi:hypothetical protein